MPVAPVVNGAGVLDAAVDVQVSSGSAAAASPDRLELEAGCSATQRLDAGAQGGG